MQGAASTTATVQITQTTWVVHLKGRLVAVVKLTTVIATWALPMTSSTWAASTRSATGITAVAALVLKLVLRVLVLQVIGAMVHVT